MEDDLSHQANERRDGRPPHTPYTPRPLPNRPGHLTCQMNSTRPFAVQLRLDWLPDNAPSHVRWNISACKGILILPHRTYIKVQYPDQLLHALDIVRLVQSSGVAPAKLINTFGGVSGELFDKSGRENILQYALHKNYLLLTVVWQEEYCCLEQLLTTSTRSVLVHLIWRQVSSEMFFTIIHVLWRALPCSALLGWGGFSQRSPTDIAEAGVAIFDPNGFFEILARKKVLRSEGSSAAFF
jgi:hypothetical protein